MVRFAAIYADMKEIIDQTSAEKDLQWWRANNGPGMSMNWPQFEVCFTSNGFNQNNSLTICAFSLCKLESIHILFEGKILPTLSAMASRFILICFSQEYDPEKIHMQRTMSKSQGSKVSKHVAGVGGIAGKQYSTITEETK